MSDKTNVLFKPRSVGLLERSHKIAYVNARLKQLGLNDIELMRAEARYLPDILGPEEQIGGVAAGRHATKGHIMLVATDSRIIVVDCKPLFRDSEDISYFVIDGVNTSTTGYFHAMTLHTRSKDIQIKTFYGHAAEQFKRYINERCLRMGMASSDNYYA